MNVEQARTHAEAEVKEGLAALRSADEGWRPIADDATVERVKGALAAAKARWTMGHTPGADFDAMVQLYLEMPSLEHLARAAIAVMSPTASDQAGGAK